MNLAFLLIATSSAQIPIVHGVLHATGPEQVIRGEDVVVELSVPDREAVIHAECKVGDKTTTFDSGVLPAGEAARVVLDATDADDAASCLLVARFANGLSERREQRFSWTWVDPDADAEGEEPGADPQPAAPSQQPPPSSP